MPKLESKTEWILLIHQLPPKPTNLRVRIWRKLNNLGAVSIKNSVYVLPLNEKTHEDFEWLKKEIEAASGEATVFRAESIKGTTDKEIIDIFKLERDKEFLKITADFDALIGAINEQQNKDNLTADRLNFYETELRKLHAELERIVSTDFFIASKQKTALSAYERSRKVLQKNSKPNRKSENFVSSGMLSRSDYQNKRWVTRRNMHIDRVASAWLIKRFIDKQPKFYFVVETEKMKGAIHFDMFEAEFTHVGEDCTFETLIKQFGLNDNPALQEIAEIVHDIDLKDGKNNRLEAAGLNIIVRGMGKLLADDRKLLAQSSVIFDGLYEQFSRKNNSEKGDKNSD